MGQVVAPHRLSLQFYQAFTPSRQEPPALECLPSETQAESHDRRPHELIMSGMEIAGVGQRAGVSVLCDERAGNPKPAPDKTSQHKFLL
jgi:hypothetical protein